MDFDETEDHQVKVKVTDKIRFVTNHIDLKLRITKDSNHIIIGTEVHSNVSNQNQRIKFELLFRCS